MCAADSLAPETASGVAPPATKTASGRASGSAGGTGSAARATGASAVCAACPDATNSGCAAPAGGGGAAADSEGLASLESGPESGPDSDPVLLWSAAAWSGAATSFRLAPETGAGGVAGMRRGTSASVLRTGTADGAAAAFTTGADASVAGSGATGCGSQEGHSLSLGGISRPHSGQIQWNMIQSTRNLSFIRSGTYPTRIT